MKLKAPETVFSSAGFCPGCGHGLATRLIGEVSEELGIQEKMLAVVDVACCSFNIDYWRYDTIMAAHGRDIPTAVGVKHIRPANPVFAYLGDGAAYSIGMAETVHAALRNDNICVFVVNNSVFGMTGGQMAPTTLPHQKTATSPKGKDPAKYGTLNQPSWAPPSYLFGPVWSVLYLLMAVAAWLVAGCGAAGCASAEAAAGAAAGFAPGMVPPLEATQAANCSGGTTSTEVGM